MSNWYKNIIFSSYNLNFPEEIYSQINETIDSIILILNNLIELPQSPIFIKKIEFINPYFKKYNFSNIYLNNEFVEQKDGIDIPGIRDRITGDIYINIYKLFIYNKSNIDINYMKKILFNHLIHELSHSIDPKIIELNKEYNMNEYLKPTEFDAYSKEITENIKNSYKDKNNRNILKNWIITDNFGHFVPEIIKILNMPEHNYYLIQLWKQESPELYRRLRERIYNEVLSEDSVK